jgi:hypothetical protein
LRGGGEVAQGKGLEIMNPYCRGFGIVLKEQGGESCPPRTILKGEIALTETLVTLSTKENAHMASINGCLVAAQGHFETMRLMHGQSWDEIIKKYNLPNVSLRLDQDTGAITYIDNDAQQRAMTDFALRLSRLRIGILPLLFLPVTALFVRWGVAVDERR